MVNKMSEPPGNGEAKLYHERQVKELCALHALNNLLQSDQAFTKKDLDDICIRYVLYLCAIMSRHACFLLLFLLCSFSKCRREKDVVQRTEYIVS